MPKKIKKVAPKEQSINSMPTDEAGEDPPVKAPTKKKRPLPLRILLSALRVVYLWVPVALISTIINVLVILKLVLCPQLVQDLIITNFNKMSYGDISLTVKDFSPYGGFAMEKIKIRNGEEFNRSTLLEIERIAVRYDLFSMLIGNVRIPEIGIYKPRIYLEEKNGVWNAARLMKPGEKKEEKKEEEKKEEPKGPAPKEINLPISVEFLFKFMLDDLRAYVKGSSFSTKVEGLTFGIDIWVPPFKNIPLSPEAVKILDRMKIELNPKEEMNVSFYSSVAELAKPLILTWKLVFNKKGDKGKPTFASVLKVGTNKAPIRFKRSHLAPLSFLLAYDLFYNPATDVLQLNHFNVEFKDKKWLSLKGQVREVTKKPNLNIRMDESAIDLGDLYPYFVSVTGNRSMRFGGVISLAPLAVQGTPGNLDIDGGISMRNMSVSMPAISANFPSFNLNYSVYMRNENMKILAKLLLPQLFYSMGRKNHSGANALFLSADVSGYKNFSTVELNSIRFRFYNPRGGMDAVDLGVSGTIHQKPVLNGNIKNLYLRFFNPTLLTMLPPSIGKSLEAVPFKKPVTLNLKISNFSVGKEIMKAALGLEVKLPDYEVNDLKLGLDAAMNQANKKASLNSFFLGSASKNLSINAKGSVDLRKPPFADSDLSLRVQIDSKKLKPIWGPWKLGGLIQLNAFMKGDLKNGNAHGNINIEKLFVANDESKMAVDDLNMHFPFEYYFTPRYSGESRLLIDKSMVIDNKAFQRKPNFTIKAIKIKHPARPIQFTVLKDFATTMFFKNNTFDMPQLKMYVLDGAVYGRNILFNLADMKPKNWEYKLVLDITNVDIGKLDDPDPEKKTRDAELSLNANFVGRDLSMFVGKGKEKGKELTLTGYINLYKVGEKIANKLLKGLSEQKGKSKVGMAQFILDNSATAKGFNFKMDKGLVYTTVELKKLGLFGYTAGIKNDKIEFNRMPIQEYLNNILGAKKEEE